MQQHSQQPSAGFQQMQVRIQEPNMHREDYSSKTVMPQGSSFDANIRRTMTQAGVSNFAQQLQQIGQQLQYLMERLHYAQNQVQTQAEAQLRELQQIQQAINLTMQQMQQAQISANMQPNIMQ